MRACQGGAASSVRYPALEAVLGPLCPLGQGYQSRVYAAGDRVVKVYRSRRGEHLKEAENLRRAGLGARVLATLEGDGVEALVMPRLPGRAAAAEDLPRVTPQMGAFLAALHREREGEVNTAALRTRVSRFRGALSHLGLADLIEAVRSPLESGTLSRPAAFCHLDLWVNNLLVTEDAVHVIDWSRAAPDDPLRDLALFKTGCLDLLPAPESLTLALSILPPLPGARERLRAYLAHTYLHDLYWFLMHEPYSFDRQAPAKIERARHALAALPG